MRRISFKRWKDAIEALWSAAHLWGVAAIDVFEEDPVWPTDVIYVGIRNLEGEVVIIETGESYERFPPAGSVDRAYELWLTNHEESHDELFYDLHEGEGRVWNLLQGRLDLADVPVKPFHTTTYNEYIRLAHLGPQDRTPTEELMYQRGKKIWGRKE